MLPDLEDRVRVLIEVTKRIIKRSCPKSKVFDLRAGKPKFTCTKSKDGTWKRTEVEAPGGIAPSRGRCRKKCEYSGRKYDPESDTCRKKCPKGMVWSDCPPGCRKKTAAERKRRRRLKRRIRIIVKGR